jgi:hypothetical protein
LKEDVEKGQKHNHISDLRNGPNGTEERRSGEAEKRRSGEAEKRRSGEAEKQRSVILFLRLKGLWKKAIHYENPVLYSIRV